VYFLASLRECVRFMLEDWTIMNSCVQTNESYFDSDFTLSKLSTEHLSEIHDSKFTASP